MTLLATLYTRPGCHLCEAAEADLRRLHARHPHALRLVDITTDAALMQAYGERIPVVAIAGREYDAPLSVPVLERALQAAAAERR